MPTKAELASNFSLDQRVEAFFTGGPVQWTTDGSLLFTICGGFVKSFNVDTGKQSVVVGDEQNSSVTCICLSRDNTKLVVSYANLLLASYSLNNLNQNNNINNNEENAENDSISTIKGHVELSRQWKSTHRAPVLVMQFSEDGNLLASGSADFTVKVWDLNAQYCSHTLKGGHSVVTCLRFYAETLFIGYGDGAVKWMDLSRSIDLKKRLKTEWKLHNSRISDILADEKNHKLVISSRDQTISTVDLRSMKKVNTVPVFEAVAGLVKAIEGSEMSVISVGEEGKIKMWDLKMAQTLAVGQVTSCDGGAEQVLVCPQKWLYLVVGADHTLMLVDSHSLRVKKQFVGFNQEILSGAFVGGQQNLDGEKKAVGRLALAATSPQLRLYNTADWSCQLVEGHSDNILTVDSCAWNLDIFASGSKDNTIRVWILRNNDAKPEQLASATGHTNNVTAVKFGRLGKTKFLLSVSADTTLKVWPLDSVLLEQTAHKQISKLSSEENRAKLSASFTVVAHLKETTSLDISANDSLCATASLDKTVKLWHIDTKDGRCGLRAAGTISGHKRGVWDVQFSDTEQVIATASGDCTVKIFSLSDRSCIRTFDGHPSAVLQVRFLSAGQQLVSADSGGLLKLWTIRSNECVKTLEAHRDKIWLLLLSADQKQLVTGGSDACISVWEDATEKEKLAVEKRRTTKLAQEQQLSNLLERNLYAEALRLALHLARPFGALNVIEKLIEMDSTTTTKEKNLQKAIKCLRIDLVSLLLEYTSEWNTNSRHSHVAQTVLFEVLNTYSPSELLAFPNISSLIESLLPYTKRHFDRLTRVKQKATFLNYTWQRMRLADVNK